MRYKKLEPTHVQGMCVKCGTRKQTTKGYGKYRPLCHVCHRSRHNMKVFNTIDRDFSYYKNYDKKKYCERCGFIAKHPYQLDIHHIDGNSKNNTRKNLSTVCANCHRLITHGE